MAQCITEIRVLIFLLQNFSKYAIEADGGEILIQLHQILLSTYVNNF